jgi:tRNA pseudouridine65 synthase
MTEEIKILHQDEEIVVAVKPSGLLVHRSRESRDTVFLLQELGAQIDRYLYPVHRLDRAASGAITFAFSSEGARALQERITADDTVKEYLVLVRGSAPESGESCRPLTADNGVKREARTTFSRIAEFSRCSLLRARIHTGRRHQIRRHFAHLRHHLIGDTSYGKGRINQFFRDTYQLPRLFLHAWKLEFRHPRDDTVLRVCAPLQGDLAEFLGRLPDVPEGLVEELRGDA